MPLSAGMPLSARASSFACWLPGPHSPCLASPPRPPGQVREVQHRIHELLGIPEAFGESLYVLQYAQGQVGRYSW